MALELEARTGIKAADWTFAEIDNLRGQLLALLDRSCSAQAPN